MLGLLIQFLSQANSKLHSLLLTLASRETRLALSLPGYCRDTHWGNLGVMPLLLKLRKEEYFGLEN